MGAKNKAGKIVYDIIIIGAGPAGSELAYRMAGKGFKVLVLEKDIFTREKPCGGGIPVQEIIEFGDLPKDVIERGITKARIISPSNNVLETRVSAASKKWVTVKRSAYDSFLQQRAREAGALMLENRKVSGIKFRKGIAEVHAGKKYLARLAADASGYPCSIKGIERGIDDRDIMATHHVWMKVPNIGTRIGNSIEIYCGRDVIPRGYAWIYPKKHVVSVGIGTTKEAIRADRLSLKNLLRKFIRNHPIASKKLKNGRIVRSGGGLIPAALLDRLYSGNVVFVGDAGGFANPLHGGGIYQARKSSVIAAEHCARFLKAKPDNEKERRKALEDYDSAARKEFYDKNSRYSVKIRGFFWNDELLDRTIEKAKKEKNIRDAMGSLLSMVNPHRDSYNTLESGMLDIIHSAATEKVGRYKRLAEKEMGLFGSGSLLDGFARHSFFGDAKRLRVSLVLLSCDIFRGNLKKAAELAPVYELLHTASLVHDDIMDNAQTRRGKGTLHSIHGVNNAIVAGDYLIGKTYSVLSRGLEGLSERQKREILGIIGESASGCCTGQVMDLELARMRRYGRMDDYIGMIRLKTGSMIKGAMEKGAVIADASPFRVKVMGGIGGNIGMAFQIIDDSIDLLGNGSSGRSKTLQNDLAQGKITPMLIHALKNADKKDRRFLMNAVGTAIGKKDTAKVIGIYRETGAIEFAQRLSGVYVNNARKEIGRLKRMPGVNKDAVRILGEVVDVLGYWDMMGN